jgi:hypothetical protein
VPSEDEFAAARLSGVIPLATDRLSRITGHGSEVTNTPFLIDRPKRLKTAVTQTKQTPEAISNGFAQQPQSAQKPHYLHINS